MDTRPTAPSSAARDGGPFVPRLMAACAVAISLAPMLGATPAFAQDVSGADADAVATGPELYAPAESAGDRARTPALQTRTRAGLAWERVGDHAVVEGDMIIGDVDADGRLHSELRPRGLGYGRALGRWPDGVVPYEFTDEMDAAQRDTVRAAIDHWTTNTRIAFVERTPDNAALYTGWLQFFATGGCASFVGRVDRQPQPVYVQGCTVGSVIHELGHAVGLYHEHTRPDRDMWITIAEDEIQPGREFNFEIQRTNAENYGPYDYGSIMHYGERFFARADKPTIIVPPGEAIGQRVALSDGDISAVNSMYATDLALEVATREAGELYELDVRVSNLGALGASGLEMVLTLGDGTEWVGMSPDSGWDCLKDGDELYCRRETLPEDAPETVLKLQASPGEGVSLDDLHVRLASRTLDTDRSNNVVSAPALAAANEADPAEDGRNFEGSDEAPASSSDSAATPDTTEVASAGSTGEGSAPPTSTTSASSGGGSAGGGASGPAGLAGMLCALCLARLRRARRGAPARAAQRSSFGVAGTARAR